MLIFVVFESEYIQLANDTTCSDNDIRILEDFPPSIDRIYNVSSSKNECERYCSLNESCWGCFASSGSDHWKAIENCKDRKLLPGEKTKEIIRKPSKR